MTARDTPADADAEALLAALARAFVRQETKGYLEYNPSHANAQDGVTKLLQRFGAAVPWAVEQHDVCAQTALPVPLAHGNADELMDFVAEIERDIAGGMYGSEWNYDADGLLRWLSALGRELTQFADVLSDEAYTALAQRISAASEMLQQHRSGAQTPALTAGGVDTELA